MQALRSLPRPVLRLKALEPRRPRARLGVPIAEALSGCAVDARREQAPAPEALHRTRLREDPARAERLRSRVPGELSRQCAAPSERSSGVRSCWSLVHAIPGRAAQRGARLPSGGTGAPHLGELDLQVADGARQGRRLLVWLSVLHGPVAGGHGSSALPGPRRPSLRRRLGARRCSLLAG